MGRCTVLSVVALMVLAGCVSTKPRYKVELETFLREAPSGVRYGGSGAEIQAAAAVEDAERDAEAVLAAAIAKVGREPLSLDECLAVALANNRIVPATELSVQIAEAQLRQALSFYWPQITGSAIYSILKEDPDVVVPETDTDVTISGLGPVPLNLNVVLPQQQYSLMDRENFSASILAMYPVFTGGKRPAIVRQARFGVEMARHQVRRTELKVVDDVKRTYYGWVFARELQEIIGDALTRMEVTMQLTERLYQGGSMKVKKTDFLRTKVFVEGLRSVLAVVDSNEELAKSALVNLMGLPWTTDLDVEADELPFEPYAADLTQLVGTTYRFNPDWNRLRAGLQAVEAKVKEAQSDHFPMVALFGQLNYIHNDLETGVVSEKQKDIWAVGIGMEFPVFVGFRHLNQVREAKARLETLKHQGIMIREGLALLVKKLFLDMNGARNASVSAAVATEAATENRKLHIRAYREELVETADVIEAQLVEVLSKALYQRSLYSHLEAKFELEFIVGQELARMLVPEAEEEAEHAAIERESRRVETASAGRVTVLKSIDQGGR